MRDAFYTLALWHVKSGQEAEFLRVWREELGVAFLNAVPTAHGTLVQSLEDPHIYYSFGPWQSMEQMSAARMEPTVRAAMDKLRALCVEARPGPYRVVMTVPAQAD